MPGDFPKDIPIKIVTKRAGSYSIQVNLLSDELQEAIMDRIEDAVNEESQKLWTMARRLAPIRKAFYGEKAKRRFLTRAELSDEPQTARRALKRVIKSSGLSIAPPNARISANATEGARYARVAKRVNTQGTFDRTVVPNALGRETAGFSFKSQGPGSPADFALYGTRRAMRASRLPIWNASHPSENEGIGKNASPIIKTVTTASHMNTGEGSGRGTQTTYQFGGRLRKSIDIEPMEYLGRSRFQVVVRANAPYARYVEFPTSRTAAQPFMRPALMATRKRLLTTLKNKLNRRWRRG